MPIKKKDNKGFTLIEVMAAIIVLAVVSFAIFPTVIESINKSKEKLYKEQVKNILDIADSWFDSHEDKLPPVGSVYSIDIETLKIAGLLKKDATKNPLDKEKNMDGKILVYYNATYKKHMAIYCDSKDGNKYYGEDKFNEVMNLCNRTDIKSVEELSE